MSDTTLTADEESSREKIESLKSDLVNAIQRGDEQFDRAEALERKVKKLERFIRKINSITEGMMDTEEWD